MATVSIADSAGQATRNIIASIRRTFPDHIPIYACAILFCGATLIVTQIYHIKLEADAGLFFLGMMGQFLCLGLAGLAVFEFVALLRAGCPDRPLSILANRIATRLMSEDRPSNAFHALIALTPLMVSFTAMKDQIPIIHPFAWDRTFMEWDRWLGMGSLPWEILQPWLGHAWITASINFLYDAWFLVMFCVLFSQVFAARSSALRNQFFLAFAFAWFIGGNLLAAVFSSAGPCFYGLLKIGPDPYAAQMAYLHATAAHWPVWSIGVQDALWKSYVEGHGAISGISAMPSMHVTVAMLLAIWGWRAHRWLGWSLSAFAALIVVGSIHLAWHYAVDGIAAIVLATLFWITAGIIARAAARHHSVRDGVPVDTVQDALRA